MAVRRKKKKSKDAPGPPREPPKVYIETSVWGMTLEDQPAALRQPTRQFLRQCSSGLFITYISTVVTQEIARAGEYATEQMVQEVEKLVPVILQPSEDSEE